MAHARERYIEQDLRKLLGFSPLVGLLGHRQVGKTTVLERVCRSYHVLDLPSELKEATQDPEQYLKARAAPWTALDECQRVPSLFPALKDWVRKHKRPGQFVLSGSVRFTSRDAIKESLTGRIMNLELLPFSVTELAEDPLSDFAVRMLQAGDVRSLMETPGDRPAAKLQQYQKLLTTYSEHGGLPGVCFIRDEKLRNAKIAEQLLTILDRDLRMVQKITVPYSEILACVRAIAGVQGRTIDWTELRTATGLSIPTIKKIAFALEAVFIIRTVPIEGGKGTTLFFEDIAEWRHLCPSQPDERALLTHAAFMNLRTQFEYGRAARATYFQYRTRGGALIPFCFRAEGSELGIIPVLSPDRVDEVSGSIQSFLGTYGNGKVLVVFPGTGKIERLKQRVLMAPLAAVV